MSFVEYMIKVSKYLKKHYDIEMDFKDIATKEICGAFRYC